MALTFFTGVSRFAAATATALALAACGGGGSDTPTPTTGATTTFPIAAAMASYARDTRTVPFTLTGTGTSGGQTIAVTGSGNIAATIIAGTFEGAPAQVRTLTTTGTLTAQGTSSTVSDRTVAFYDANYQALGSSTASSYCVHSGITGLPASAKVGDTGTWYSATCYTNSTKSVRTGAVAVSYAIESLTATSVILKVTLKFTPQIGTVTTQEIPYTITAAGAVSARETAVTLTVNGVAVSVIFKFL